MSRLTERFAALKARNEKALICYVMAGDPSLDKTVEIVKALDLAGVDAVELGVPFSDPMADGPSIQSAGLRALERGATVPKVFEVVRQIRQVSQIPIVMMTYYNPTLRYGVERFARDAAAAGVDATIQTDLTPEEADEWIAASGSAGLDTVFLVAPTSTQERIRLVCDISSGFVYCVSRTGVTGAQSSLPTELAAFVDGVKQDAKCSVCVGFGISKPEHIRAVGQFADGAVVGSALINVIAKACDAEDLIDQVTAFARDLKSATLPE